MYINQPCFTHFAVKAQSNVSLKVKSYIRSCVIVLQLISVQGPSCKNFFLQNL